MVTVRVKSRFFSINRTQDHIRQDEFYANVDALNEPLKTSAIRIAWIGLVELLLSGVVELDATKKQDCLELDYNNGVVLTITKHVPTQKGNCGLLLYGPYLHEASFRASTRRKTRKTIRHARVRRLWRILYRSLYELTRQKEQTEQTSLSDKSDLREVYCKLKHYEAWPPRWACNGTDEGGVSGRTRRPTRIILNG
ncbi:1327_t:CDS:2 [Paraglomus brasilianum]|uniref:1327_t:CDS:1 n=1 Tax=Paraglomus brasilianum TaxID=144538 RepID=A0A9N9BTA9_9GLOM|nr:1327_t:CDS:2 [Paraglomus brasilianum]